ncbi:peptidylprolyl isomerase [Jannaschia sp. CCS1]|uniref:peptidylprolyl isomerase n=1 Tax=Jannaschia sp. (strain CCS1) TaxID=290400 RepID=UPI000053C8EE|nr:peptidylprolyl isomerase [Jannaschia sp. CCS1]ABD54835.1 peptidyl-prolyl cis-trans isomerase cyclophilin type [Jannaschia sp. CCS1]
MRKATAPWAAFGPLLAALLAAAPIGATGIEIDVAGEAEGTIVIDLFEDVAPLHVERITTLATEGAYDDIVFHRVIDGFMAQTGDVEFGGLGQDMRYAGRGGSTYDDLPAEFSDLSFERGTLGMARSQRPDSANSQFFIVFEAASHLNGQYTVFGQVVDGMDVVDMIRRGRGRNGAVTGEPDRMTAVRVLDFDPEPPEPEEEDAEEASE